MSSPRLMLLPALWSLVLSGEALLALQVSSSAPWTVLPTAHTGPGAPGPPAAIELPDGTADWIAAGDFDADGRLDLVAAVRGGRALHLLSMDDAGEAHPVRSVELPGTLSELAVGEFDAADGLNDIAAGVTGPDWHRLLLFRSWRGALREPPREVTLPAAATGLLLGQLDGDYPLDVAVAAGDRILLVHGRRRDAAMAPRVPAGEEIDRFVLPAPIVSLAAGALLEDPDGRLDLAALTADRRVLWLDPQWEPGERKTRMGRLRVHDTPAGFGRGHLRLAKVATRPSDDLLLVDEISGIVHRLSPGEETSAPVTVTAIFTVNSPLDAADLSPGDGSCNAGGGACTLRAAIQEANALEGADTIQFSLGPGTPVIAPLSVLPPITETVTIEGSTGGATRVQISGAGAGAAVDGLVLTSSTKTSSAGSVVRALVINGFTGIGILIGTSGNTIVRSLIGTDSAGGGGVPGNTGGGVLITGPAATGNVIGGVTVTERNVISNNGDFGVRIDGGASGNFVRGNFIGTDGTGAAALANLNQGVVLNFGAANNTIGGVVTAPGAPPGNVVSGNDSHGVLMAGDMTDGNIVAGNLVGTTSDGGAGLANGDNGIYITNMAEANQVGGATLSLRNVISGNSGLFGDGVQIDNVGTDHNAVWGNLIGTEINGLLPLPNGQNGVLILDGPRGVDIGGESVAPGRPPGNVISGNDRDGVRLEGILTTATNVAGNIIGADASGASHLANAARGVTIHGAPGNTIGGGVPSRRNLISGNGVDGVRITSDGAADNKVAGNFIGLDVTGSFSLPNGFSGVWVDAVAGSAPGNRIGGPAPAPGLPPGNVISGNGIHGVVLTGPGVTGTVIEGNLIGTDAAGGWAVANQEDGVRVSRAASGNTIGGGSASSRNVISGNGFGTSGDGVEIDGVGTDANAVLGNYIGTDITGESDLSNFGNGVLLGAGASNNRIGDPASVPGAPPGNVISGNDGSGTSDGVEIVGDGTAGNRVAGNIIGLKASGVDPLSNGDNGILIWGGASGTLIGGTFPGAGNVISGNKSSVNSDGVEIRSASSNQVFGNRIGTDATGTQGAGNLGGGVMLTSDGTGPCTGNVVGGSDAARRNVISANGGPGVGLFGALASGNAIQGNFIGADITGTSPLGNQSHGVHASGSAGANQIGGLGGAVAGACAGECNLIAFNLGAGVALEGASTAGIAIRGNGIHSQAGLGIDLAPLGMVNPNDPSDGDSGPNQMQNFPEILSASFSGTTLTVTGELRSADSSTYKIDVFSSASRDFSGHGEGAVFLGTAACVTDAMGLCSWTVVSSVDGEYLTATATAGPGHTSEFSAAFFNPGEVLDASFLNGFGTAMDIVFTPACGATDHVVYAGTLTMAGAPPAWSSAFCGLGVSGMATFDPGTPAAGSAFIFAIVGQTAAVEGSYGQDASGGEIPEAVMVGSCDLPQALGASCS